MIVAYTFDADQWCPQCTLERFCDGSGDDVEVDENGVPFDAEDSEGNPVHPVFSWDEHDLVFGGTDPACRGCVDKAIEQREHDDSLCDMKNFNTWGPEFR